MQRLIGESSPHIKDTRTTQSIMRDVLIALLPASVAGVWFFGIWALLQIIVSVAAAVLCEALIQRIMKKPVTISDLSAAVTGLLVAMNVPAGQGAGSLLMCAIGSAFAIIVVKQFFGGLGHNFVNPALAARAFMMASWPSLMSRFTAPDIHIAGVSGASPVDVISGATPLNVAGQITSASDMPYTYLQLFMGNDIGGVIGEVCKLALLLGAAYLLIRGVISWRIPVTYILTFALLTLIPSKDAPLQADVLYQLLSGGLILGAFFMATDYTTSPTTFWGQILMGVGCGILTFVIRRFGNYPEGVSYSILLMNVATPLLERLTTPRKFGHAKRGARAA